MKTHQLAGALIALALCLAANIFLIRPGDPPIQRSAPGTRSIARQPPPQAPQDLATRDQSQTRMIRAEWTSLLAWLDGSPAPTPEQIRSRLHELRSSWAQLDPHVLAKTIESLLDSQENRPTALSFAVGPQGFLAGWPDLRTFLVDTLAIADPDESARIARTLLRKTDSSSEFAVAIRSLIRGGQSQASTAELVSCLHTLLGRREWQGDAALAESLDLARFVGTREVATALLSWNGHPQARDMALHEFAADHPGIMIATLTNQHNPPPAALLARADPSDPAQAAAVDSFLRDPGIPLEQRASFLALYPLRSITTGYRLYRGNPAPYDQASIHRSDQAALAQAESWLEDPALAPLHDALVRWRNQLIEWRRPSP